ncbi:MAG: hypothetical protein ACYDC9_08210 [Dermatophilaceae bacterium]
MTRPSWATSTVEPVPETGTLGMHSATVTVGDVSFDIDQVIGMDGSLGPVLADPDGWTDCDAQGCRDLAAALLEAARIIEEATV